VQANIAYAGLYHHKETGLYLATYRGYNPFTARWLNRDPIEENGGLNLYEYVGGEPIGYIDPEGKNGVAVTGIAITAYFGYQAIKEYQEASRDMQAAIQKAKIYGSAQEGQIRCLNIGVCSYQEKLTYDELVNKLEKEVIGTLGEAAYNLGRSTPNTSLSGFGPPSLPMSKTEAACELGKSAILGLGDR
jgi:RHS repeat-associated protein